MKKFTLILILSYSRLYAADTNVPIEPNSNINIETGSGNINISTSMTSNELLQELQINPPTSNINSFTGPNGCTDCNVDANTAFDLMWNVQNVAGCTASNTTNNPEWQGTVEPFGGGTGIFQTTISGIAENTSTAFTLNCPAPQRTTYHFNYYGQDTIEIIIPRDIRMLAHNYGQTLTLINIVQIEKLEGKQNKKNLSMSRLVNNVFYTEAFVEDIEKMSINIENNKQSKIPENIITWFFVSETDPRLTDTRPYDIGRCDSLSVEPQINLSTFSIMREKTNLQNICSIEPDKKYFLTRVFLKREIDIKKLLEIINKNKGDKSD